MAAATQPAYVIGSSLRASVTDSKVINTMSTGPALDARFAVSHPQLLSRDIKLLHAVFPPPPPFGGKETEKVSVTTDLFSCSFELMSFFTAFKKFLRVFFEVGYSVVTSSTG